MPDRFATRAASLEGPATHAFSISPDDSDALSETTRALYVGTGGTITCRLAEDASDTLFSGVPDGTVLPVRVTHVRSTGTSASQIVGLV